VRGGDYQKGVTASTAQPQPLPQPQTGGMQRSSTLSTALTADAAARKDEAQHMIGDFIHRQKRLGFMRRVYTILGAQMATTAGVVALMSTHRSQILRSGWFRRNFGALTGACSFGSLGLALFLQTSPVRFRQPANYLLLGLFTLLEAGMVGTIGMMYKPKSVLLVGVQTAVAFLGLTAYSFQNNPKYDLTEMGQALGGGLLALIVGGLLNAFVLRAPLLEFGLSVGGAALFAAYIVHDTHRMIGGRHRDGEIDSREHVRASMALYIDLVNLFLYLLRLLGAADGGGDYSE